jgi:hypothetical protein
MHFSKCVDLAKKNYKFIKYSEAEQTDNFILWRHDIDFSMHVAKKLAIIEADKEVTATYFIYPHSEFYNLLEKEIFDLVNDILKLGHQIGLHFDSHFYNINYENDLENALKKEKKLLEDFFETEIKVFSFHNNNEFTLSCENWEYAGMINTYAKFFKTQVGYCSDSHGIWRFSRLYDLLEKADQAKMQVLTHPEWWQEEPMAPRKRILRCVESRAKKNIEYYDNLLIRMGRPNIDEEL